MGIYIPESCVKAGGHTYVSGSITADTTWLLADSPYIVTDDLWVEGGVTLTIEPGVSVRFDGYYSLYVNGTLFAVGTNTDRIIITSNMTVPGHNDWVKVQINSNGHGEIKYCNISYGFYGIHLHHTSTNNITNNNISFIERYGILSNNSGNNNINNNIVSDCQTCIFLNDSIDDDIMDNIVVGSGVQGDNGIELLWSTLCEIEGNSIFNADDGVHLQSTNNIFIKSNNIYSNGVGIRCIGADWIYVIYNDVRDNGKAIRCISDFNFRVHHNNFINSTGAQAYAENWSGNKWDNGWPSGGNYWSDYGGIDNRTGPNQDFPGSDGLGDTPYEFFIDSQDNYPLMKPVPDLEIKNTDIICNPSSPVINGTSILINATICNVGRREVDDIVVRFYIGDPSEPGSYQLGPDQFIPSLNSSDSETLGVQWIAGPIGSHDIFIVIDPDNTIVELNKKNNVAFKTVAVMGISPPVLFINTAGDDIILNWTPPSLQNVSHHLIYRSTSQNGFDFSNVWVNTSLHNDSGIIALRTTWNDTGAASIIDPQEYYYTMRTVYTSGETSSTSRTVGKWTKSFQKGVSAISLPLEPLESMTIDHFLNEMNATYIKWMDPGMHIWMKHGDGISNDTQVKGGEAYEVEFENQTNHTFCGMPGAMIMSKFNAGFLGFDPVSEAKNITTFVDADGNVTLTWQEPSTMAMGDWYEVYYSNTRDGFFGARGVDYDLACPALGSGNNTTTIAGLGASDPGVQLYFVVVPFNASGERGSSTYSIGVWTEEYLAGYDTICIPLKMEENYTVDWYCDNIPDCVGINYYIFDEQRWGWHSTRMAEGAFDPLMEMGVGYQISTSGTAKFTFVGF